MEKKTVDEIIEEFKNQYTELCLFNKWIDNCYQSLSFNRAEIKKKKKYKSIEKNRMVEEIRKTDRDLNDFQIKREKLLPKVGLSRLKLQEHLLDYEPIEKQIKKEVEQYKGNQEK